MSAKCTVETIPILKDNFVYLLKKGLEVVVIDPGDPGPVSKYLESKNLRCVGILATHHHSDHVGGIPEIQRRFECAVYGPAKKITSVTHPVCEGQVLNLLDLQITVMEVPGHTLDHVAYWVPSEKWLFSGDVLFALGCGRLFEGSPEQMFQTLARIKALPLETQVYCTHDYFGNNFKFCRHEQLRIEGYEPRLPLQLKQELHYNPFLAAEKIETFRELRAKRNNF